LVGITDSGKGIRLAEYEKSKEEECQVVRRFESVGRKSAGGGSLRLHEHGGRASKAIGNYPRMKEIDHVGGVSRLLFPRDLQQ
jgi:hypothetical protein